MKKQLLYLIPAFLFILLVATGCNKSDSGTNTNSNPDISSFSFSGSASATAGQPASIAITSTSLGTGIFTIHFGLSGANAGSGLTATLDVMTGTGTFGTPVLTNAGTTTLTMTSISNAAGYSTPITGNNTVAITTSTAHDSTGLMTATVGGAGFRATDISTSLAGGTLLTVTGTAWEPQLNAIVLYFKKYASAPTTVNFSIADTTYSNGSASYILSGGATVNAAHGRLTITTTSPLLAGTFSFTNTDSTKISGSFTAPRP